MNKQLFDIKAGMIAVSIIDNRHLEVPKDYRIRKGDILTLSDGKVWRFMYINAGGESITVTAAQPESPFVQEVEKTSPKLEIRIVKESTEEKPRFLLGVVNYQEGVPISVSALDAKVSYDSARELKANILSALDKPVVDYPVSGNLAELSHRDSGMNLFSDRSSKK